MDYPFGFVGHRFGPMRPAFRGRRFSHSRFNGPLHLTNPRLLNKVFPAPPANPFRHDWRKSVRFRSGMRGLQECHILEALYMIYAALQPCYDIEDFHFELKTLMEVELLDDRRDPGFSPSPTGERLLRCLLLIAHETNSGPIAKVVHDFIIGDGKVILHSLRAFQSIDLAIVIYQCRAMNLLDMEGCLREVIRGNVRVLYLHTRMHGHGEQPHWMIKILHDIASRMDDLDEPSIGRSRNMFRRPWGLDGRGASFDDSIRTPRRLHDWEMDIDPGLLMIPRRFAHTPMRVDHGISDPFARGHRASLRPRRMRSLDDMLLHGMLYQSERVAQMEGSLDELHGKVDYLL